MHVALAPLDADGALGDGGQHRLGRDRRAGDGGEAEAAQAGHGEEGCGGHALLQFPEPRLHVAAELDDAQVRSAGGELGPAAQGGGADDGVGRQGLQRAFGGQKGVAGVLAGQKAVERQAPRAAASACPSWSARRCRAARPSSASSISRVKSPFPPKSLSGSVLDAVAGGGHGHDLERRLRQVPGGHQAGSASRAAWASASGEPRVPMRRGWSGMGRV